MLYRPGSASPRVALLLHSHGQRRSTGATPALSALWLLSTDARDAQEPPLGSLTARATVTHAGAGVARPVPRPPPVSAAGTHAAPGKNRVVLEKGFSQVDWMRLTRTHPDLSGVGASAPRSLTLEEVAQHASETDCWTVLDGRVYNVTHYIPFHPGGRDTLLQGAGRDSSALFKKYHPWVNAHFMLAKCLVGRLADGQPGALPAVAQLDEDDEDDSDD